MKQNKYYIHVEKTLNSDLREVQLKLKVKVACDFSAGDK
jgi:hypothetical protein